MSDHDFGIEEALAFGTGYAFMRAGQDAQTAQIVQAIQDQDITVNLISEDDTEEVPPVVNALDYTSAPMPEWDDYIGQGPLKKQIEIYLAASLAEGKKMPHTLLASGMPGVGKTTMARLIAMAMGSSIIELVPPFKSIDTIINAANMLNDRDVLFIDEIHKLTDGVGSRGAEVLLKILEDGVAYRPDGSVVKLNDITIIGATTDPDKLPEPVIDRFKIQPYFQAYDVSELGRIAIQFTYRHDAEDYISDELAIAIAYACRGIPRIIEKMVEAAKALSLAAGQPPTPEQLLAFLEVEPDGLTRTHIHYITAMRQYFGRETKTGDVEYIVGETAIQQILRETKQGIGRIERFLVERGLVDRTPRGRRLTPAGIQRAEEFIYQGKGASDVA